MRSNDTRNSLLAILDLVRIPGRNVPDSDAQMSTPASHYKEAERLLVKAADCVVASITRQLVDLAQVHATLATCYEPDGDYGPETAVDCMLARETVVKVTGDRL